MRILGLSKLAQRAQQVVRGDPRFADVLAVEQNDALYLYRWIVPPKAEEWEGFYAEWAKMEPIGYGNYRLAHLALTGQWQELDVFGSLEDCVRAIVRNQYHLFFG